MTTLHTVLPPASDAKFIGDEPTWSGAVENYNNEMLAGFNWHNYCAGEKDYVKYIEAWIREYRPNTAKHDIVARRSSAVEKTLCVLARMQMQGFPLNEQHQAQLEDYVNKTTTVSKKPRNAVSVVTENRPTIQDRIRQQVSGVLSSLDVRIDDAFDGDIAPAADIKGDILSQGFKSPQLKLVSQYLNLNLAEWQAAYDREDEQLVEGYAYMGRREMKNIIDTFTEVLSSVSQQNTHIKANRVRKRKPMDKKKMAKKLRFMTEDTALGVTSAPAVDIIGANVIWVYNTKKRRLGYYEAEVKDSLYVKGTKIAGYKMTCEKILRKPEEQITHLLSLRKNQTTSWFDTINAKCKLMNGRTNTNLILLRVD